MGGDLRHQSNVPMEKSDPFSGSLSPFETAFTSQSLIYKVGGTLSYCEKYVPANETGSIQYGCLWRIYTGNQSRPQPGGAAFCAELLLMPVSTLKLCWEEETSVPPATARGGALPRCSAPPTLGADSALLETQALLSSL